MRCVPPAPTARAELLPQLLLPQLLLLLLLLLLRTEMTTWRGARCGVERTGCCARSRATQGVVPASPGRVVYVS